jgi:hypothetical protein
VVLAGSKRCPAEGPAAAGRGPAPPASQPAEHRLRHTRLPEVPMRALRLAATVSGPLPRALLAGRVDGVPHFALVRVGDWVGPDDDPWRVEKIAAGAVTLARRADGQRPEDDRVKPIVLTMPPPRPRAAAP